MSVKEVKQAGASTAKLATLVGKAKQFIIDKTTWRPHIMDGSTPGGYPLAMVKDFDVVNEALNTAITNCGGTPVQD